MNKVAKSVLLVIGAYGLTTGIAILVSVITMALLGAQSCRDYSDALLILWGAIAAVFFASLLIVAFMAWKITQNMVGFLGIVIVHGAALFVSHMVFTVVLMIAFNC